MATQPDAAPPADELIEQPQLGEVLRSLRQARGHTLGAVAAATGISDSFIALVETRT